ncbi:unnamed protein product [Thlaspi arvense]|uniref:Uncharacterized protein n=1 Tax=Thlaspi arvense TaxID=13288 RepID=A0AAU9RY74_THLAR|nr:unnamed protein product [Thlaspi arvense]
MLIPGWMLKLNQTVMLCLELPIPVRICGVQLKLTCLRRVLWMGLLQFGMSELGSRLQLASCMLASGSDDGSFSIRDLRLIKVYLQDPWRHASKQTSSPELPSYTINCRNCGHGTDLRGCPQSPMVIEGKSNNCSSSDAVNKVRQQMVEHIGLWLSECHGSTRSSM